MAPHARGGTRLSRPSSWLYVWLFLAGLTGGLVVTPIVGRFARRMGVVDAPSAGKAHLEPVSLLGGMAIYAGSFLAAFALVDGARAELKGFFLAGLVILVFGIQDDITPMDPWVKFLAQVTTALVLIGYGVQVRFTHNDVLDVVVSVVWIVGVINAFNYQDNMNGLAAGLAAVSSLGFFALAVTESQYLVAVVSIATAGGCLGFLRSNFPRARIFMGDAGSMFLGLLLAFLGIRLRFPGRPDRQTFFLPIMCLGVPLLDALLVTVSRLRRGISPTLGGQDHTSHRVSRLGSVGQARAAVVLWGAQALLCLGALAIARNGHAVDLVVVCASIAFGLAVLYLLERPAVTARIPAQRRRPPPPAGRAEVG